MIRNIDTILWIGEKEKERRWKERRGNERKWRVDKRQGEKRRFNISREHNLQGNNGEDNNEEVSIKVMRYVFINWFIVIFTDEWLYSV